MSAECVKCVTKAEDLPTPSKTYDRGSDSIRSWLEYDKRRIRCLNPYIQPRTEADKAYDMKSADYSSRRSQSMCGYDFKDWTHPYYHKSDSQSKQEIGISELIPTWNKAIVPPISTLGISTPIYRSAKPREPMGCGYKAMWEFDRIQPRERYSRYTMPNPMTHSLKTLQSPQTRQQMIPNLEDQRRLMTDFRNLMCQDPLFRAQSNAYQEIEKEQANKLNLAILNNTPLTSERTVSVTSTDATRCTTGASHDHTAIHHKRRPNYMQSESTRHSEQDFDNAPKLQQHCIEFDRTPIPRRSCLKKVKWSDQQASSDQPDELCLNTNNNCNGESCSDTSLKECDDGMRTAHVTCSPRLALKSGRKHHFLDTNSSKYKSDIPTDYSLELDPLQYQLTGTGALRSHALAMEENQCYKMTAKSKPTEEMIDCKSETASKGAQNEGETQATSEQHSPDTSTNRRPQVPTYDKHRAMAEYYNQVEPNIYTQRVIASKHPCLLLPQCDRELLRLNKMKELDKHGCLHYSYQMRGIVGYTGHQPSQALEFPAVVPTTNQQPTSMYKTTYNTYYGSSMQSSSANEICNSAANSLYSPPEHLYNKLPQPSTSCGDQVTGPVRCQLHKYTTTNEDILPDVEMANH